MLMSLVASIRGKAANFRVVVVVVVLKRAVNTSLEFNNSLRYIKK